MKMSEKDTTIIQQALQNQFDMEEDMFHDNAWLDVAAIRDLATKSSSEIDTEIKKMRDMYDNNLSRLLALQRFISTIDNS